MHKPQQTTHYSSLTKDQPFTLRSLYSTFCVTFLSARLTNEL